MGLEGGTLLSGWHGALIKEWTFLTRSPPAAACRKPLSISKPVPRPASQAPFAPDRTSALLYGGGAGYFLNKAAYSAPAPGTWGSAGRDSIIGPNEFSLDASMARTFRLNDKLNLDARVDSTNAHQPRQLLRWNTHRHQSAVWLTHRSQRNAQPANHASGEVLA